MTTEALLLSVERASRRSALLMALGAVIVFAALWLAVARLVAIRSEVAELESRAQLLSAERTKLLEETTKLQSTAGRLEHEISGLRQALSASRDALAAFHARDYSSAVRLYELALAADPGNAYLMNLQAYSLFKLGRIDEAITLQTAAIDADPNYAWGYFDLARFQCAAGDKAAAAKSIALATSREPRFRELSRQDGEFRRLCGELT